MIKDRARYIKLFRSCSSFITLLFLLGALISMGGCKITQPAASGIHYAPPVPVLERHEGPFVRVQQEDPDVRVVSQYRPQDRDHLSGPKFRHPSENMKVKEIFFQDVPLEIAAGLFNELGGINLMLESSISREKVRVYLRDVTMSTALETMLRGNDLWFRTNGPVTTVMSQEAYADQMIFRQSEKLSLIHI